MTEQDQRIVIAEACGWTGMNSDEADDGFRDENGVWHSVPPDYLHDLNAMHEAENWLLDGPLTDTLGINYWNNLWFVAKDPHNTLRSIGNATAAQRAEAFLRTIGKWKD